MVAGWDRLLPPWFSKLHDKYRTPVNSILVVGACSFTISLLSLIGVGQAEAFQLLFNASGMFYALAYVVMFAIPLLGLRGITPQPPLWLKAAAWSGLIMTLAYVFFAMFPIIRVENPLTFGLKIALVVLLANLAGYGILRTARSRA
jgi:amino acid transporter